MLSLCRTNSSATCILDTIKWIYFYKCTPEISKIRLYIRGLWQGVLVLLIKKHLSAYNIAVVCSWIHKKWDKLTGPEEGRRCGGREGRLHGCCSHGHAVSCCCCALKPPSLQRVRFREHRVSQLSCVSRQTPHGREAFKWQTKAQKKKRKITSCAEATARCPF